VIRAAVILVLLALLSNAACFATCTADLEPSCCHTCTHQHSAIAIDAALPEIILTFTSGTLVVLPVPIQAAPSAKIESAILRI
jgi:hypothetical protein